MIPKKIESHANDFMNHYQIMPIQSKEVFHNKKSWVLFCQKMGVNPRFLEGKYLIRYHLAHIKQSSFCVLNWVHEYLGHGGMIDNSDLGRQILYYEHRIGDIEMEIQKGLNLAENYLNVKQIKNDYQELFDKSLNLYEGYAQWLECKLGEELGLDRLVSQRQELLHPAYKQLRYAFDKFEHDNGTKALIEQTFHFEV